MLPTMEEVLGERVGAFALIGMSVCALLALVAAYTLWRTFRVFFLARILGPAVDIKGMGRWAVEPHFIHTIGAFIYHTIGMYNL